MENKGTGCPFKAALNRVHQALQLVSSGPKVKAATAQQAFLLLNEHPKTSFYSFMKLFLGEFWTQSREYIRNALMKAAAQGELTPAYAAQVLSSYSRSTIASSRGSAMSTDLAFRNMQRTKPASPGKATWVDVMDSGFGTAVNDVFHLLTVYRTLCEEEGITPLYHQGIQKLALQLASTHISVFSYISGQLKAPAVAHRGPADYAAISRMGEEEQLEFLIMLNQLPYSPEFFFLNEEQQLEIDPETLDLDPEYLRTELSSPERSGCPAMYAPYHDRQGKEQSNIILDRLRILGDAYALNSQHTPRQ